MRNTGELQLTLPKLGDDWQWNISTKDFTEHGGRVVLEVTVKAERGIWEGRLPYESVHSMPVYLRDSDDYDQIIERIQAAVDDLAESVKYYTAERKTPADAWRHILNVFAAQPVEDLHLRGVDSPKDNNDINEL